MLVSDKPQSGEQDFLGQGHLLDCAHKGLLRLQAEQRPILLKIALSLRFDPMFYEESCPQSSAWSPIPIVFRGRFDESAASPIHFVSLPIGWHGFKFGFAAVSYGYPLLW